MKFPPKVKFKRPLLKRSKLKWGIAGCGRFSEEAVIPNLELLKKSIITAVYSSDEKRSKEIGNKFSIKGSFNDFNEFLKQDFDILYVGSANKDHYWQVIEAAKAGKHILCEKPMALTTQEAKEMLDTCTKNNVFLTIDYVHRFHPICAKAKEIIQKSTIGSIISISASFNIDLKPSNNFRFKKKESGGGALRDIGTHMIDVLRFFGGEVEDVTGFIDNVFYKSEVDDFAAAILKFKKGNYGIFNVSFNSKCAFNRIEIVGSEGSIAIDDIIGSKKAAGKLTIDIAGEAKKAFRKRANKLVYLLKSVEKSILNNEQPLVTGYDGLYNMEIMEKIESKCLPLKN